MNIAIKLSDDNTEIKENILNRIDTDIEIQMCDTNLVESFYKCTKIIDTILEFKKLSKVSLHLPFKAHTFDFYIAYKEKRELYYRFINLLNLYSNKTEIEFYVVIHQESTTELINECNGIEIIKEMVKILDNTNITLLVENCLPCLNYFDIKEVHTFTIVNKINDRHLNICLDLCHCRCCENILKEDFYIPSNLVNKIKWIHFSNTTNNDGYLDRSTHSTYHHNIFSILEDLRFLSSNGIDLRSTSLCIEITEKDYVNRPIMCKEIDMLNNIKDIYKYTNYRKVV